MIRVLHVIGAMDRAGAETLLMNIYRSIDRDAIQFDFLVNSVEACDYDEEIEDLGGRIFRVPRYNVLNKKAYAGAVRELLQAHPEDVIVHSHIGSAAPVHLRIANEEGRHTIAHSHAQTKMDSLQDLIFHFVSKPVRGIADQYMACSPEAAVDRFGDRIASSDSCTIIRNGIPADSYRRNRPLVDSAKNEFDVAGKPVFGHVGRFSYEKNHPFLLDVFDGIHKRIPDAVLLLAGRGDLESRIRTSVTERDLGESVRFLGVRDDIPKVFRAMDVFLFPSHHEGLGIAFVEAQATGLECIGSTGVPESAICTDRAMRLPLTSVESWVDAAVDAYGRAKDHSDDRVEAIKLAEYDIQAITSQIERIYLSIADGYDPGSSAKTTRAPQDPNPISSCKGA